MVWVRAPAAYIERPMLSDASRVICVEADDILAKVTPTNDSCAQRSRNVRSSRLASLPRPKVSEGTCGLFGAWRTERCHATAITQHRSSQRLFPQWV